MRPFRDEADFETAFEQLAADAPDDARWARNVVDSANELLDDQPLVPFSWHACEFTSVRGEAMAMRHPADVPYARLFDLAHAD